MAFGPLGQSNVAQNNLIAEPVLHAIDSLDMLPM
jgi:hypothetical protein